MVYIYNRIASDNEEAMLEQEIACRKYASDLGLPIHEVIQERASGFGIIPPMFDKLTGTVTSGDVVIVKSLDRIGRSLDKVIDVLNILLNIGVKVHSVDDKEITFDAHDKLKKYMQT